MTVRMRITGWNTRSYFAACRLFAAFLDHGPQFMLRLVNVVLNGSLPHTYGSGYLSRRLKNIDSNGFGSGAGAGSATLPIAICKLFAAFLDHGPQFVLQLVNVVLNGSLPRTYGSEYLSWRLKNIDSNGFGSGAGAGSATLPIATCKLFAAFLDHGPQFVLRLVNVVLNGSLPRPGGSKT